MNPVESADDVVTVIRLMPVANVTPGDAGAAVLASLGHARMRMEGSSIVLILRDADPATLRDIKAGDIVQWVAEPLGVIWRAEQRAGDPIASPPR